MGYYLHLLPHCVLKQGKGKVGGHVLQVELTLSSAGPNSYRMCAITHAERERERGREV